MNLLPPFRLALALSLAGSLALAAGCSAPTTTNSQAPAAVVGVESLSAEDQRIAQLIGGSRELVTQVQATEGQAPASEKPAQDEKKAAYGLTAAPPAIDAQITDDVYVGPYPAAGGLPSNFVAVPSTGSAPNPKVTTSGAQQTTETRYVPADRPDAAPAVKRVIKRGGQTIVEAFAGQDNGTTLPEFFVKQFGEPKGVVTVAHETYTRFAQGPFDGTAVGYRWIVRDANGNLATWIRALKVTTDAGKVIHFYDAQDSYVFGKALRYAYGSYDPETKASQTFDSMFGIGVGRWKNGVLGTSCGFAESELPNDKISRLITYKVSENEILLTLENYNADGSGSGTVSLNNVQKGTMQWGPDRKGTLTLASGTVAYAATRFYPLPAESSASPSPTPAAFSTVSTLAGTDDDGFKNAKGSSARFNQPQDALRDGSGNVYVADTNNDAIRKITPDGTVSTLVSVEEPTRLALAADGTLYASSQERHVIYKITGTTATVLAGSRNKVGTQDGKNGRLNGPYGLALSGNTLYVADYHNQRIRKVDVTTGDLDTVVSSGISQPAGIAVDGAGNLYFSEPAKHIIRKLTSSGTLSTLAGKSGSSGSADKTGDQARFSSPCDVAAEADGTVYVADSGNARVRKITSAGVVTTLAGSSWGSTDGAITSAKFAEPCGLGLDASGLLVTEPHRIRLIKR